MSNPINARTNQHHRIIDEVNVEQSPKRFRMCTDPADHEADTAGLAELKASASGQFSQYGLKHMKNVIPNDRITIVDLRQECHGYVNGMAVSWYGEKNDSNKGMIQEDIIALERKKLDEYIEADSVDFDYIEGKSFQLAEAITGPRTVYSEEELAEIEGFEYVRFCVTDHHRPPDEVVDQFVEFVKALTNDSWLHFHCRGGVGRATSFILMYDMMRNADKVSLSDILNRQQKIGGRDMYRMIHDHGAALYDAAVERLEFINTFYDYCVSQKDEFEMSWSEWLHTQEKAF